jgi:hypothetical protein
MGVEITKKPLPASASVGQAAIATHLTPLLLFDLLFFSFLLICHHHPVLFSPKY